MSPKVKTADAVAEARRAALDRGAKPRSNVSEREAEADYQAAMASLQIDPGSSPEPYGPGSKHSWFADQAFAHASPETMRGTILPPLVGSLQAARSRLAVVAGLERRDLTTTVTDGGNFVPSGVPGFIGDAFAAAVRTAAVLPGILPVRDLPETGMSLKVPRITTGSTTAVHATENTSVSETDLVEELGTNPITTISGASDLSRQLLDRSEPGMADVVLATELGLDLAADLDLQLLQGSGTSGQMLGLITVTGIGTTLYTDATATQQESFVQILKAASDQSVALGQAGDAILLHPRRRIWFSNWRDTAAGIPATIPWPAQLHDVPAIPTTAGAGTEDYALILRTDELPVYLGPVVFEVFPELNSAVGTVKARARQYASALFTRRPEAIMKVSGTGYIAPVYA